jgi:hypothetical protein
MAIDLHGDGDPNHELIGYDAATGTFPPTTYSNLSPDPRHADGKPRATR